MSGTIKLIVFLLLVAALGLPMILKGPDGQPIMTLSDWLPDKGILAFMGLHNPLKHEMPEVGAISTDINSLPISTSNNTMYKWRDERGQWHFSNEKPPIVTKTTVEQLPEIKNVMEAPVKQGDNSSSISPPSGFNLGN